jgi:hypothetical protein
VSKFAARQQGFSFCFEGDDRGHEHKSQAVAQS